MNSPFAFRITNFDYTHGIITVDQSCWYRAYDPEKVVLSDYPAFFGDIDVAYLNLAQGNRKLGEFIAQRPLHLLDMRYVMSILPYIITVGTYHPIYDKVTVALGLCSFKRQIELLNQFNPSKDPNMDRGINRMERFSNLQSKPSWVNPIELKGVRIGIGDIDFEVVMFLKDLFSPIIDGIIAPRLQSPFHDQMYDDIECSMMYEELIIFKPSSVLTFVQDRAITPTLKYYLPTGDFQQVVNSYMNLTTSIKPVRVPRQRGGNALQGKPLIKDKLGELMDTNVEFRRKMNKLRNSWLPIIRNIHNSQSFFQKKQIPMILLSPEMDVPLQKPY